MAMRGKEELNLKYKIIWSISLPFTICDRDKIPEHVGTVISKQISPYFLSCSFKFVLFLTASSSHERRSGTLLFRFFREKSYLKGKIISNSVILEF